MEQNGEPVTTQVDRRGSWERQLEAVLPIAWHRACWPISPSSRTLWPEACSIHTGPSSITCADPVLSGMPSTTARPPPTTRCRRLCGCASSADGPDESTIQRGRSPHHPTPAVHGPIRNAGLSYSALPRARSEAGRIHVSSDIVGLPGHKRGLPTGYISATTALRRGALSRVL